jgi:dethiobiotin synthetase
MTLKKDISFGQKQIKKEMGACQNQLAACQKALKSEISDMKAAQREFKETIADTLDRQLEQQDQSLREASGGLQVTTRHSADTTRRDTHREFEAQMA